MRWTEIAETFGHAPGVVMPTYRQMDTWTRDGKITAETRGDAHGRFRWWPPAEVEAALMAAALMAYGLSADLAFRVARQPVDDRGTRRLHLVSNIGVDLRVASLPVEVGAR